MYVLLQIDPLEARGDDDPTPLDAITVDGSHERLEEYLTDYQERYRAACVEFAAQDPDPRGDWTSVHDCLSEALMDRHCVYGALMAETTFKIVEVLAQDRHTQPRGKPNVAARGHRCKTGGIVTDPPTAGPVTKPATGKPPPAPPAFLPDVPPLI